MRKLQATSLRPPPPPPPPSPPLSLWRPPFLASQGPRPSSLPQCASLVNLSLAKTTPSSENQFWGGGQSVGPKCGAKVWGLENLKEKEEGSACCVRNQSKATRIKIQRASCEHFWKSSPEFPPQRDDFFLEGLGHEFGVDFPFCGAIAALTKKKTIDNSRFPRPKARRLDNPQALTVK